MKLSNRLLSTILILLIGLNSFTSTFVRIKSQRKSLSQIQKSNSNKLHTANADDAINYLKGLFTKENMKSVLEFGVGILSVYFHPIGKVYEMIKIAEAKAKSSNSNVPSFFAHCYEEVFVALEKDNKKTEKTKEEEETMKNIVAMETATDSNDKETKKNKKKYCDNTKSKVQEIYEAALDADNENHETSWWKDTFADSSNYNTSQEREIEAASGHSNFNHIWFTGRHARSMFNDPKISPEEYCDFPMKFFIGNKKAIKEFGSREDFKDICMEIKEKNDCSTIEPTDKGSWNFVKAIVQYKIKALTTIDCIKETLQEKENRKQKITPKEYQEVFSYVKTLEVFSTFDVFVTILKTVGGVLAHVFTGGIWGILHAAWYIIKIVKVLIQFAADKKGDKKAYLLGKLVGYAIKVVSYMIKGSKRRK